MTDNLLRIIHLGLGKQQALPLQLIAGDVVLQHRALCPARLHLCNNLLRQFDILRYHLQLVLQLIEVEVMACKQEPHLLTIFLYVKFGYPLSQLGHFNARPDGTTRIDHLSGLSREAIAPVGGGLLAILHLLRTKARNDILCCAAGRESA